MNKAYKFRIYPNKEQQILLSKTFGCVRFVYNKIKHYETTKEKLNVTPAKYKNEFEWLKEVDSLALAKAQLHLQTAYNNFFRDKKVGYPKLKSKRDNRQSYTTNCVKETLSLNERVYRCEKCGRVIDRDYNASLNIKKEGMRMIFA